MCDFAQDGISCWLGCETVACGGGIRGSHYPKSQRALGPDHQTVLPASPLIISQASLAAADHGLSPAELQAGVGGQVATGGWRRWPGVATGDQHCPRPADPDPSGHRNAVTMPAQSGSGMSQGDLRLQQRCH